MGQTRNTHLSLLDNCRGSSSSICVTFLDFWATLLGFSISIKPSTPVLFLCKRKTENDQHIYWIVYICTANTKLLRDGRWTQEWWKQYTDTWESSSSLSSESDPGSFSSASSFGAAPSSSPASCSCYHTTPRQTGDIYETTNSSNRSNKNTNLEKKRPKHRKAEQLI